MPSALLAPPRAPRRLHRLSSPGPTASLPCRPVPFRPLASPSHPDAAAAPHPRPASSTATRASVSSAGSGAAGASRHGLVRPRTTDARHLAHPPADPSPPARPPPHLLHRFQCHHHHRLLRPRARQIRRRLHRVASPPAPPLRVRPPTPPPRRRRIRLELNDRVAAGMASVASSSCPPAPPSPPSGRRAIASAAPPDLPRPALRRWVASLSLPPPPPPPWWSGGGASLCQSCAIAAAPCLPTSSCSGRSVPPSAAAQDEADPATRCGLRRPRLHDARGHLRRLQVLVPWRSDGATTARVHMFGHLRPRMAHTSHRSTGSCRSAQATRSPRPSHAPHRAVCAGATAASRPRPCRSQPAEPGRATAFLLRDGSSSSSAAAAAVPQLHLHWFTPATEVLSYPSHPQSLQLLLSIKLSPSSTLPDSGSPCCRRRSISAAKRC
jgi:hypothetical protein